MDLYFGGYQCAILVRDSSFPIQSLQSGSQAAKRWFKYCEGRRVAGDPEQQSKCTDQLDV